MFKYYRKIFTVGMVIAVLILLQNIFFQEGFTFNFKVANAEINSELTPLVSSNSGISLTGGAIEIQPDYLTINDAELIQTMEGSGTVEQPYIISTLQDLLQVKDYPSANYKLANDIDLNNEEWTPIGNAGLEFTGTFDGNGYTISNLTINKDKTNLVGLFGKTSGATINNVNINNASVKGQTQVGVLIGYAGTTDIENCSVKGTASVNGVDQVGGLIGIYSGKMLSCNAITNVSGSSQYVGGLIGHISSTSTVENCYATGTVNGTGNYVGGFAGTANSSTVRESYATGKVKGVDFTGGLFGYTYNGKVENSFSLGDVEATYGGNGTGGLVGNNSGTTITNCYAAGEIVGAGIKGGLIGNGNSVMVVTSSYYDGVSSKCIPNAAYNIGKLTSGMKQKLTFGGWNFTDIWDIEEGTSYPYLRSVAIPNEVKTGLPTNEVLSGIGTIEDPYVISTKEQLNNIKYEVVANYKLANDIDLNNEEWTPIGNIGLEFTGTFDGNGYTISNLSINKDKTNLVGLFGKTSGATIKNVNINNASVKGQTQVGVLVGYAGTTDIENCSVKGTASVNGVYQVGGLIGIYSGKMLSCIAITNVSGSSHYVGGLIGHIYSISTVESCYATGTVNGTGSYTGGFAGYINSGTGGIYKSYATGNVTGNSSYVGGFAGIVNSSIIRESYATGKVKGVDYTGGLLGRTISGKVENSFSLGDVEATSGENGTGGLVGNNYETTITNCYAAGEIGGAGSKGGLIGTGTATVTSCYFDGVASKCIPNAAYNIGKLTSGMKQKVTFGSWNFTDIWDIEEGTSYPYLRSVVVPNEVKIGLPTNEVLSGIGTIEDPYIISTKEQLNNIKYEVVANYKLANGIDLNNEEWNPIGNIGLEFTGTFDGNGYTISNLTINKDKTNLVGLFGKTSGATIKNVNINNASVKGQNQVGVLVGYAGTTNIENCLVKGISSVDGVDQVGGLVGIYWGNMSSCNAITNVSGSSQYVGGLIGHIYSTSTVENCYATGTVNGTGYYTGGFAGYINSGTGGIYKSYATGNVTGSSSYVGGFAGTVNSSIIRESYATGKVKGVNYTGGLLGRTISGKVENSFSLGDVEATSGENGTGGLVGNSAGTTITNCYSAGEIVGAGKKGGLIGNGNFVGEITSSYYDGVASKCIPNAAYNIGKLTSGMKQKFTFGGWNFTDIWDIEEGNSYPYLRSIVIPNEVKIGLPTNEVLSGIGTIEDPYIISTKEQINNVNYDLTGNYKLANDIDLNNEEWIPIGNAGLEFTGTFDGNGYTISNLSINKDKTNLVGLFGKTSGATIKNININNASVKGQTQVGVLVGYAGTTDIENCSVKGIASVNGVDQVGGLVGIYWGKMLSCNAITNVSASSEFVGGLIGYIYSTSTVENSYATGTVNGTGKYIGGLVGYLDSGAGGIYKSYATGNVSGNSSYVGGLVGIKRYSTIRESYATGKVKGANYTGGLLGYTISGKVENSFSLGDVEATSGGNGTGGLVGNSAGTTIINCYAAGEIGGAGSKGGLIGTGTTKMTSSYYDGIASKCIPNAVFNMGKLTSGMKQKVTFGGWNFTDIWDIEEGNSYPYLRSILVPNEVKIGLPTNEVLSGIGTIEDPYIISTKEQLNNIKYEVVANYKLANDIDLNNEEWTPIGSIGLEFTGTFDGNGYTISNLTINKDKTNLVGLFGKTSGATIKNVNINNASVKGQTQVGVLVGYAGTTNIENCSVKGTASVNGLDQVGGLIGIYSGKMLSCNAITNVSGSSQYVGGLIGHISLTSTVENCYAIGTVNGTGNYVGGFAGCINSGTGGIY